MQMDKASTLGDAATYVQELQAQAQKLKAEVEGLEASHILDPSSEDYSQVLSDQRATRIHVEGAHRHLLF